MCESEKYPLGNCLFGEISFGELSAGEISAQGTVLLGNLGKLFFLENLIEEMSVVELP